MERAEITDAAIANLYREFHQPIVRYLTRIVGDRETAEDLAHETFIKALRSWPQHDSSASARGWLYRIAINTAYDELRRRRHPSAPVLAAKRMEQARAPDMEAQFEAIEPIQAALNKIPARFRIPLLLHTYAGYDVKTIATALGSNANTIKTRLFRARAQFRQLYAA
jgi:RNA polymerase sigma-70 factor (ECF subfamily)